MEGFDMFGKLPMLSLLLLVLPFSAWAVIHTETIEYKDGETALEEFLVYNDALQGKRPGVIVVHEIFAQSASSVK
jgi:hypothetical protein